MQKLLYIFLLLTLPIIGYTQITADIQEGCVPLQVNSNGLTLGTYFWDFDDSSGNSDESSPSRIFDMPGVYNVELFEGQGGQSRGTVTVTVYADPLIAFSTGDLNTCAPLFVEFTNESTVDPNVPITGYQWTFGDGGSSTLENPTPSTVPVGFTTDVLEICEAPATFNIVNNTSNNPEYTYMWDFGNSTTSDVRDPGSVTYNEEGTYTIKLTVDNGDGCLVTRTRNVRVGGPKINLNLNDTVCINSIIEIGNNTDAAVFQWTFSEGIFPTSSTDKTPEVQFLEEGDALITLNVTAANGCMSDTIISIYVQDPDATYTADPLITCLDPASFTLTANDPTHAFYSWNGIQGENTLTFEYDDPDRDSFYINRADTIFYSLNIVSTAGCQAFSDSFVVFRDIEAHFIPDVSRGCAPLTVDFAQMSQSAEDFVSFDWDFGDGNTISDTNGVQGSFGICDYRSTKHMLIRLSFILCLKS